MSDPAGLSTSVFEGWLRQSRPDLVGAGALNAQLLHGGLSNLTYRLDGGPAPFVLRRPPLGHVLTTAHDMAREFRVISALRQTSVPVPEAILYQDDGEDDGAAGVGTPFYLMSFVDGLVLSSPTDNAGFTAHQLRNLSLDLVGTLASLHTLEPDSVGLHDFGHPEGFVERQLRRWGTQYDKSASRSLPELDRLQEALRDRVPVTEYSSLIHGDFRLDNAIVKVAANGTPTIASILDWEMATIGDSFTDLGLLGLYWDIRSVAAGAAAVAGSAIDPEAGYPRFEELVDEYAAVRGIRVPELSWYIAFAAYKLAIILEGIYFRYQEGNTVGEGFAGVGDLVTPLARAGLRSLAGAAPDK
jgi:aminoglycoside phosphotransferase (APT) family kinase protein